MEFAEKLQQLRKQADLTQGQLAEKLYVSRTAVSKWETGNGYPNLDSLKDIAKIFKVSIDELLSNDELIELAGKEAKQTSERMLGIVFGAVLEEACCVGGNTLCAHDDFVSRLSYGPLPDRCASRHHRGCSCRSAFISVG